MAQHVAIRRFAEQAARKICRALDPLPVAQGKIIVADGMQRRRSAQVITQAPGPPVAKRKCRIDASGAKRICFPAATSRRAKSVSKR